MCERQGSENLVAGCAGRRGPEEFDGADMLREGQFPIDWVSAGDGTSISAKASKRDMGPKWPLVTLTVCVKERNA